MPARALAPSTLQSWIGAGIPLSNAAIGRTLSRAPHARAPVLEPGTGYDGMWHLYADEVIDRSLAPEQVKAVKEFRAWMEAGFAPDEGYAKRLWATEAGSRAAAFPGNAQARASLYAELQRQIVQVSGGPGSSWHVSVERGADGSYIFRGDPTRPNPRIFVIDPQGNCYAGGVAEGFASRGAGKTVNYAKLRPIGAASLAAPGAPRPRVGPRSPVAAAPSRGVIRVAAGAILPMLALGLVSWWLAHRTAAAERAWLEQLVATKLDPAVAAGLIDQAATIDRLTAADRSQPLYANITADFESEWVTSGVAKARASEEHVMDIRFVDMRFGGEDVKREQLIETTDLSQRVVAIRRVTYSLPVFDPAFEAEKARRHESLNELLERHPGLRLRPTADAARALDVRRWVDAASQLQTWLGSRELAEWRETMDTARREKAQGRAGVSRLMRSAAPAPAPKPDEVAAAESVAVETATRIEQAIRAMANLEGNEIVSNTAELFTARTPRLRARPMTPRTDSDTIRRARRLPHGSAMYFFIGTTQQPLGADPSKLPSGTVEYRPVAMGAARGRAVLVRGQDGNRVWQSEETLMDVIIHESSHALVSAYGEHPADGTAALFNRYRSEFRAYFLMQFGPHAKIDDLDDRADAIRRLIVGTSLYDTEGYPELRKAYHTPANSEFRAAVKRHKRPDGFNLNHSIRLDNLFSALDRTSKIPKHLIDVRTAIAALTPSERAEARNSPLIAAKIEACGADAAWRIRTTLDAPADSSQSPRIARLFEELTWGETVGILAAYDMLKPLERDELQRGTAAYALVDRSILEPDRRAGIHAMLAGRSASQYERMLRLLAECERVRLAAERGEQLTGIPPGLRAAALDVTLAGRVRFYWFVKDARERYVDRLPDPVRRPLRYLLHSAGNP